MTVDTNAQVAEAQAPVVETAAPAETKGSNQEKNLRNLARKNEALEQQNQQLLHSMNEMKGMVEQLSRNSQTQQKQEPTVYERYGIQPGDLVESDKLIKILQSEKEDIEKRFERKAEEIAERALDKRRKTEYGDRLISKYPDYNQVINEDTMDALQQEEPEFVEMLSEIQDDYKRRELAYKKAKKILEKQQSKLAGAPTPEVSKMSAQSIVDANKKSAYAYAPGGGGTMSSDFNWKDFHGNAAMKQKAYENLKAMQGGRNNNPL